MQKYAMDDDGDLIRGDALTFAYSGSDVATLIDGAGTGFKVRVGTHNLLAIAGDTLVLASEPDPEPSPDFNAEYTGLTNRELKALCDARQIDCPSNLTKAILVGLLLAADEDADAPLS
jgi:hypothetical protein